MKANKLSSEKESKIKKEEEEEEEYDEEEEEEEDDEEDEIPQNSKIGKEKIFSQKIIFVKEPVKDNSAKPNILPKEETKKNIPTSTNKGINKTKIIPNKIDIKSAISNITNHINITNKSDKIEIVNNKGDNDNKNANMITSNINNINQELKNNNHIEKIENKIKINTKINVVNQNKNLEEISNIENLIETKNVDQYFSTLNQYKNGQNQEHISNKNDNIVNI